jgi:hypothetical protein
VASTRSRKRTPQAQAQAPTAAVATVVEPPARKRKGLHCPTCSGLDETLVRALRLLLVMNPKERCDTVHLLRVR